MATHIRCYACRGLFDIRASICPECEAPRRNRNGSLETAKLNSHLYAQAESAIKEQKLERHVAGGGQAPVTNVHREQARALMEHL